MTHTIFAWTEPTPPEGFPAFVNVSRDQDGRHTVTVRARGAHTSTTVEIPVEALESLMGDLAEDLYRDEIPTDESGVKTIDGSQP